MSAGTKVETRDTVDNRSDRFLVAASRARISRTLGLLTIALAAIAAGTASCGSDSDDTTESAATDVAPNDTPDLELRPADEPMPAFTTFETLAFGDSGSIFDLIALADGRIATAGAGPGVHVQDPENPTDALTYTGHGDSQVTGLYQLVDGRVASTGRDNTVQIWDPTKPNDGAAIYIGGRHGPHSGAIAQLPDGRIVSSSDSEVHVWDPDNPTTPLAVYAGHAESVLSIAVLADGRLVSGDVDGLVHVWDPDAPDQPPLIYSGHQGRTANGLTTGLVSDIAVLPDGRVVTVDDEVHIWHPDTVTSDGASVFSGTSGYEPHSSVIVTDDGRIATPAGGDGAPTWVVLLFHPDNLDSTDILNLGLPSLTVGMDALAGGGLAAVSTDEIVRVQRFGDR